METHREQAKKTSCRVAQPLKEASSKKRATPPPHTQAAFLRDKRGGAACSPETAPVKVTSTGEAEKGNRTEQRL